MACSARDAATLCAELVSVFCNFFVAVLEGFLPSCIGYLGGPSTLYPNVLYLAASLGLLNVDFNKHK